MTEHNPEQVLPLLPNEPNLAYDYKDIPLNAFPRPENIGPPEPTRALIESVRMFGIRQPVALYEGDVEADLEIIGGRRRIQAAWICHREWSDEKDLEGDQSVANEDSPYWFVPAMVGTDPRGMAALDVQLNATAKPNELAYIDRVQEMYKEHSDKEIAQACRLPVGTVRRLIGFVQNLQPDLMAATRQDKLAFSVAEAASKLSDEQQRKLLPTLEEKGKVTGKDVAEAKRVYHESFQGDLDLGLDQMPGYEEVHEAAASAQDETLRYEAEKQAAVNYLVDRLANGPAAHGKRMYWTADDLHAVEQLLRGFA